MSKTLIKNIGTLLSGDIECPVLDADSILIEYGRIAEIGKGIQAECDTVYDANGMTVTPGLIDCHVHVSISEWGPRQSTMHWIDAYAASGITGIISAGETHVPSRPTDAAGVKALATVSHKIYEKLRPGGAKVYGGAIIPVIGLTEQDFQDLHEMGIMHTGEFGLGNAINPEDGGKMSEWGRKYGVRTMCHTGVSFLAGSKSMTAERILGLKPDVLCHISGGGLSVEDVQKLVEQLPEAMVEVCAVNKPGTKFSQALMKLLRERNEFCRLMLGTDSPSGYGIFPHGVWEVMGMLCAMCGLEPEIAVCAGSGNTANCYGLKSNMIRVGYAADLNVCDAPKGSQCGSVCECLREGTVPGVDLVMVDGKVIASGKTANTAPARRSVRKV